MKRETLCAVPESHLAELFSGRWEQCLLRDHSSNIFLDIDPTCFDKILAFLVDLKQRPDEPAGAVFAFPPKKKLLRAALLPPLLHLPLLTQVWPFLQLSQEFLRT